MTISIGELKRLGTQALEAGQHDAALRIYWRLVDVDPKEVGLRLKLADVLTSVGAPEAAAQVHAALATHAMQSGYPLVSVLIGKLLETANIDVGPLYDELAGLYSSESDRISRYGERFAPLSDDTLVEPPDMRAELTLEQLVAGAAQAGANLTTVGEYPRMLHRMPLLSDLSGSTFRRVLDTMMAHRMPPHAMVVREGEMGASFFLIAQGEVRVYRTDRQGRETELARLHEGSLFGEMALIHASPRLASVQVVGGCDLLEVTRDGLSSLASELSPVAGALDRFCRERLLSNLLATSPIFRPFSRKQRMDLLKRFTGHEVSPGTSVLREGDPGRGLYVVLSGEVDVTKHGDDGEDVLLANLRAGEVFGEIALLRGELAPATVTAARQSTILFLDKVYFQRLLQAVPPLETYFERLSAERLSDLRGVMDDDLVIEDANEDEYVLI